MLTNKGKLIIKRFLGRQIPSIGDTLSLGVANTAASATDSRLGFEIARVPVALTSYDFTNNQIVFKGTIPENVAGIISEAALWTGASTIAESDGGSRLFIDFTSNNINWDTPAFSSANTYIDTESLLITGATSSNTTVNVTDLQLDFGGNTGSDQFMFAYYNANANLSSIKFKLCTDASNYFEFTKTGPTANSLNLNTFTKSTATVVGSPDWSDISIFSIVVASGSGGAASVYAQGARIEKLEDPANENGLVSRTVFATAITKSATNIQDFEYRVGVSV